MSFTARYPGTCGACDDRIAPGQEVEYDGTKNLLHVVCPEDLTSFGGKAFKVCPSCNMTLPATGVCDDCD